MRNRLWSPSDRYGSAITDAGTAVLRISERIAAQPVIINDLDLLPEPRVAKVIVRFFVSAGDPLFHGATK